MCKALHRYSRKPAANGQIFLKSGRKSQAPAAHICPNVSLGLAGLFRIPPQKNISQEIYGAAMAVLYFPFSAKCRVLKKGKRYSTMTWMKTIGGSNFQYSAIPSWAGVSSIRRHSSVSVTQRYFRPNRKSLSSATRTYCNIFRAK